MEKPDTELLKKIIRKAWSHAPGAKAQSYVGQFFDRSFTANKVSAKVVGNYGTYRVSITVDNASAKSACSCYIGKQG